MTTWKMLVKGVQTYSKEFSGTSCCCCPSTLQNPPVLAGDIGQDVSSLQRTSGDALFFMSKGCTGQEVACSSGDMWSVGVLLFQLASGCLPFLDFVDSSSPRFQRQLIKLQRALIDHAIAWRVSSLLVPFQAACMPASFSRQHACLFFGTSCLAWCKGWCSAQGLLPPPRLACMYLCAARK